MSGRNKTLPPKENALFKRILKCYEQKLYKNGLKFAKQILGNPSFAEHAETLAMKGLILNALNRREEAYEHVRRGLKNDLKSHTCWHVYGLIQRSERKYDEAIKCYRNALKWDPQNLQILRELSIVQIHIRDIRGYRDTRHQLFSLKPVQRASWIGFAMAYHLLHDYGMAYKLLDAFRKTLPPKDPNAYDYENSELLLYQNTLLQEKGDLVEAIEHLNANQEEIYDKVLLNEYLGNLHYRLELYEEAQKHYKYLIKCCPDDAKYHEMYMCCLGIQDNAPEQLKFYEDLVKDGGGSFPRRQVLKYAEGSEFINKLRPFIEEMFSKGAPPLFTDLSTLYTGDKTKLIENLVLEIAKQLEKDSCYQGGRTEQAPASALLWTYYYLAQHYDYLEDTETALFYIDKAIEHTPTLIELFICKAKIYKHAGEFEKAAEEMDEARELDTADRYINSKSAKYHLRANQVDAATTVCGKFTREGANPMDNLNEMQCMWFQTECALAYQRTGQWGEALKKCHEVDRHFTEIIDDQYDFHTYSLRKMTLRSYVQLLRLEDVIKSHPFYFKAAKCAIEVYLHLHDYPLQNQSDDTKINQENLSPAELKKLKNKERKAKKKAEVELQAAAAAAEKKEQHAKSKQNSNDDEYHPPPCEEFSSDKLAKNSDPLKQAIRFLEPLQLYAYTRIETHLLAYDIYRRKSKPLLMLRSIKRALKCACGRVDPTLAENLVDFQQNVIPKLEKLPEVLCDFIQKEFKLMELFYSQKSPGYNWRTFPPYHKNPVNYAIKA